MRAALQIESKVDALDQRGLERRPAKPARDADDAVKGRSTARQK